MNVSRVDFGIEPVGAASVRVRLKHASGLKPFGKCLLLDIDPLRIHPHRVRRVRTANSNNSNSNQKVLYGNGRIKGWSTMRSSNREGRRLIRQHSGAFPLLPPSNQ